MLATKNHGGRKSKVCREVCAAVFLSLVLLLAGCSPEGTRALQEGRRLIEAEQYPKAVEKLQLATSLLATNADAWNYLGLALHRAGQPTNAAHAYQRAVLLDRNLLEARFNLGCLWLEENQLDSAKAEFTAYTMRRENDVAGWLKLGTTQLRLRETTAAEKSFQSAQRVNAHSVEAFNGLGLVQLQRARPRESVAYFSAALKQQPDYRPALLNLAAVLHQQLNDRPAALQKYREYLALQPRPANWAEVSALALALESQLAPLPARPQPTNQVARVAAGTNSVKPPRIPSPPKTNPPPAVAKSVVPQAKPAALEVVKLPPETVIKPASDVASNTVVAGSKKTLEPLPVRVEGTEPPPPPKRGFFSRINPVNLFRSEPKAAGNSTNAATTSEVVTPGKTATGNPAASGASRYVYLSPGRPAAGNRREAEGFFKRAMTAQGAGRSAEAAESYRRATLADPGYFEAYHNLGLVTYEARSYKQALAAWESALALQPDSVAARYNFALALKAANHPADAAAELEKVLSVHSGEVRAHLVLGNLYAEQLGNPARARAHYQRVLELEPKHPQATAIRYWLVAHP